MRRNNQNISFIIPAYNCEKTIVDSVKSIFDNNIVDGDEIVIVNDGSTDNTQRVIKTLIGKYDQVKLINHKHNKGGGSARNTAVENASNNLIFCLDSDNILKKDSISKLYNHLRSTNCDIASFETLHYFRETTKNIDHDWMFKYETYNKDNYLSTILVPGASGNYLFTKSSWLRSGRYPEYAGALDTWGFGLRQVMSGYTMSVLHNSSYYHRIGIDSYWVRQSRENNINMIATQLIIPYLSLFSRNSQKRIMSISQNNNWFANLDNHPITYSSKSFQDIIKAYFKGN